MNKRILLWVTDDPRTSPRPAEAIRIAAGVGTWRKVDITLYLQGPSVLCLSEYADELMDEDHFVRYLPVFAELGRPVLVQEGAPELDQIGEARVPFEAVDPARLAAVVAGQDGVIYF